MVGGGKQRTRDKETLCSLSLSNIPKRQPKEKICTESQNLTMEGLPQENDWRSLLLPGRCVSSLSLAGRNDCLLREYGVQDGQLQ
jgi:hypothetical protein